jgi:membrane protease YdiL (CAAX protease family)
MINAVYWDYEDVGAFLFIVACVNALVRLAVRLHFLHSSDLAAPKVGIQALVIICLGGALYAILKFRYRRPVLAPLGWLVPTKFFTGISMLGGVAAALAITYFTHLQGHVMPTIAAKEFFVLGFLLGPILEETVLRGYLLPVLGRTLGIAMSVIATAVLFAALHKPTDIAHWIWFTATGLSYGSLRVASRTTTAAAFMHAICNLTLFVCARF